jgi:hypothetical protein
MTKEEVIRLVECMTVFYYTNRKIKVVPSEYAQTSYYDGRGIVISLPQVLTSLNLATADETAVRSNVYHEVSHAILTPMELLQDSTCRHSTLNIVEDFRIEDILRNYYLDVNFRDNVFLTNNLTKQISIAQIPLMKTTNNLLYQLVRYQNYQYMKDFQKFCAKKGFDFLGWEKKVLDLNINAGTKYTNDYWEYIYLLEDIEKIADEYMQTLQQNSNQDGNPDKNQQGDSSDDDNSDSQQGDSQQQDEEPQDENQQDSQQQDASDDSSDNDSDDDSDAQQQQDEQPHSNKEIKPEDIGEMLDKLTEELENSDISLKIDNNILKLQRKLEDIKLRQRGLQSRGASLVYTGGVLDPKQYVISPWASQYKSMFRENAEPNALKKTINVYIDNSGSFEKHFPIINKLAKALEKTLVRNDKVEVNLYQLWGWRGDSRKITSETPIYEFTPGCEDCNLDVLSMYGNNRYSCNLMLNDGWDDSFEDKSHSMKNIDFLVDVGAMARYQDSPEYLHEEDFKSVTRVTNQYDNVMVDWLFNKIFEVLK